MEWIVIFSDPVQFGALVGAVLIGAFIWRSKYNKRLDGQAKRGPTLREAMAERERLNEDLQRIDKELQTQKRSSELEKTKLVSLEEALGKTRSGFFGRLQSAFSNRPLSSEQIDELEEILYTSDLGPKTVQTLMESVSSKLSTSEMTFEALRAELKSEMLAILRAAKDTREPLNRWFNESTPLDSKPQVWMIVGINGAGKTTSIGKIAFHLAMAGRKVLVAAGDTFRAAAGEQLRVWTERAQVEIFSPQGVESPSAVAFDAVKMGQQKQFDFVLIDTAGRLHTQVNLMDELKKVQKVIDKCQAGAPHEVVLVLDANAGQNALIQAREFHKALGVTGVVLTKLDGTAKGGMAVGVAAELGVPIQLIGVGEKKEDLRTFDPDQFVDSII